MSSLATGQLLRLQLVLNFVDRRQFKWSEEVWFVATSSPNVVSPDTFGNHLDIEFIG